MNTDERAYFDNMMALLAEPRMSLPEWRVTAEVRPLTLAERVRMAAQRIARRLMP